MFLKKNLKRANADPTVLKSTDWIWNSHKTETEVKANIRAAFRVLSHGATCWHPGSSIVKKKSTIFFPSMGPTLSKLHTSFHFVLHQNISESPKFL